MPLHVAFVWHMHQPSYVDPVQRTALLPWVRLHATKGYLDMIWLVEQFPEFRCTFNLTPVLLQQIEQAARGEVCDLWLELARTPAEDLTRDQQCQLLEHFFRAHWGNMVRPFPRYWSLLHKRGQKFDPRRLEQLAGDFNAQDYRDLQAWFNLAWFGYAAQHEYPELVELKRKDHDFTEQDKQTIFARQQDILQTVIGRYKAAQDAGQIEISTTPFYHPILPLVYDTEFARRCQPAFVPPQRFAQPADVRAQLAAAREQYQRLFGRAPVGLWPSEGSVCPELIPILAEQGWKWLATDEDILWRSLPAGKETSRGELWQAYRAEHEGQGIAVAFRDRTISDFIGFSAARNESRRAAEHVLGQLEAVARSAPTGANDPLCAVVLDGENAWEHFTDGGEGFLRGLYGGLLRTPHLRPTTMAQHIAAFAPRATLGNLHTGSWINANFHIWIGHAEDRRAWDVLGQTRTAVESQYRRGAIPPAEYRQAMEEIYAAEGSDWFWWYGDDFVTDDDLVFDELFRTHLENAHRLAGLPVPHFLRVPICRSEVAPESRPPTGLVTPQIDGRVTSYYEWMGAGLYEVGRTASTMYLGERIVEAIRYGFDAQQFYVRVDFCQRGQWPKDVALQIDFGTPKTPSLVIRQTAAEGIAASLRTPGIESQELGPIASIAHDHVLEVGIPISSLCLRSGEEVSFTVHVTRGGVELERHPSIGSLSVIVPSEGFDLEYWSV